MATFTVFTVFGRGLGTEAGEHPLAEALAAAEAAGVTLRGIYDVSAFRADADVMFWLYAESAEALQDAVRGIRRSTELAGCEPVWSAMGVHRDAEFNRQHVPGFLRGVEPKRWATVYPFNRSYEWYLLDPAERSRMLADHGRRGASFEGVVTNTVAAFALGDYEWLLPLEADELTDLTDMMRALRESDARLHVREEVPFFTGRRIEPDAVGELFQ